MAMHNYFTFDGKSTKDFCTYITNAGLYAAPARRYQSIEVSGRNGALTIDDGDYRNVEIIYPAFIYEDFQRNFSALKGFLYSKKGYKKLQTTIAPDEYRKAIFKAVDDVQVTKESSIGGFNLIFDCMPQRYLESGDRPTTYTAGGSIYNATDYEAKPLIRVYGNGTFGIGETTITISGNTDYTDIDCEIMDAYYGAVNRNSNIVLPGHVFPTLKPGANGITLGSGITRIIVTPRWWQI